jgi:hypothetical protein
MLRITSPDTAPWEGTVSEFIDSQPEELPELVRRRIETLAVGQHIAPKFGEAGTKFRIERFS